MKSLSFSNTLAHRSDKSVTLVWYMLGKMDLSLALVKILFCSKIELNDCLSVPTFKYSFSLAHFVEFYWHGSLTEIFKLVTGKSIVLFE